jgi:hypothetical protein
MRRLELATIPRQPWRNGAGTTRVLAQGTIGSTSPGSGCGSGSDPGSGPDSALGEHDREADWRVSVAEIAGSAPFSAFAGFDRHAVLIDGSALVLRDADPNDGSAIVFARPGAIARFSGETALVAQQAAPGTRLFNLMTRRGLATGAIQTLQEPAAFLPAGDIRLLLVIEGRYRLASGETLAPGAGMLVDSDERLAMSRIDADGWLVCATIARTA